MGLMKKAVKRSLAVSTFGVSVAAEKALKSGVPSIRAQGTNLTEQQRADGMLWFGMSHEAGRNAKISLYPDRIEREKPRSRMSWQQAVQDNEVIPTRSVTSVNIKKDGVMFAKVLIMSAGGTIPFRFTHDDAQAFKNAIMPLIVNAGQPQVILQQAETQIDAADQITKLAALRDQGILTEDEFSAKKAQLLDL